MSVERLVTQFVLLDKAEALEPVLLAHPGAATERDGRGMTPLHLAVKVKSVKCAMLLAKTAPAAVSMRTWRGSTPLHIAAARGGPAALVEELVRAAPGAEMQVDDWHQTPLMIAVHAKRDDVAEVLLRANPAAAMVQDDRGSVPLHDAAWNGRLPMLKRLLEAAPEAAHVVNNHVSTPLHLAAEKGRPAFIKALLAVAPEVAEDEDMNGQTPLHLAAASGNKTSVALLSSPTLARQFDLHRMTPLHHAAWRQRLGCIHYLLDAAPEMAMERDDWGYTPLMRAVFCGDAGDKMAECVRLLVARAPAAIPMAADDEGETCLHAAAEIGCDESVRAILSAAPEAASVRDGRNRLPLHLAARRGRDGCVRQLMAAYPAAAAAEDSDNMTPLQWAMDELVAGTLLLSVIRHVPRPLSDAEWAYVPYGHEDLLATLPAAARLSDKQAGHVVARLSLDDSTAVRRVVCALSKGTKQRPPLPPELISHILSFT